jgi:hypothetical protein
MRRRFGPRTAAACCAAVLVVATALAQEEQRSVVVTVSGARRIGGIPLPGAKRYWADYTANAIRRSNLDGSSLEIAIAGVNGPYGVGFDPAARQLVWTSAGDEVVQAASVDGGGSVTLPSSFEEEDYAFVVDEGDHQVMYGLQENQVVKVTQDPITGEGTIEVLLTLSSPETFHGLALSPDRTALYLGDTAGQMSRRLNLATRTVESLVFETALAPVAVSPELQAAGTRKEAVR